jgi:hypothetical protein
MKAISLLSMMLVSLSPLCFAASEVRISTSVFTVPEGVDLPSQVRAVTMSEWQKIVRTLSLIKGVPLFGYPAATTSSGKMTRVDIRTEESGGWWQRDSNPVFPVTSIEYTPRATRGGIDLIGDYTMNRGSSRSKKSSEIITASKVHCYIPHGKVLTFKIGEHLFGVTVSEVEKNDSN